MAAPAVALLSDCLYLLKREWPGAVRLQLLDREDHLRGDGVACGAVCKILLDRTPIETCIPIVCYIYPSLDWTMVPFQLVADSALEKWLRTVEELFGETGARQRAAGRMAALKEELIASAWKPARVAAWLEAGLEIEDL